MSNPADKHDPFDPFGIVASMGEWCCLLKAARELKDVDGEMMETMLDASATGPVPEGPEAVAKVHSIVNLMRSLSLDAEAVRQRDPETMQTLEAACLRCTQRGRCARELWAGTAADAYPEFCPNAARLDRLRHA
ncbi:DUF6455 family protein [Methylobacterium isbiliense]|uniref:DUF6455 domain-containing protein n=1 Tax=Methylobacterium isbiliense TaxID=315478 RepID=A0ABQ4SMU5_9HYPH|nr:DUF6455 family protein [Methylobacterium isbiliense]MDN3626478.1 DUF6455 family protein [Methylobacterium isbiliense]GJE04462.1 hypothetical protein GMJLKIPL_6426 [Methylobacterium isbiliense]